MGRLCRFRYSRAEARAAGVIGVGAPEALDRVWWQVGLHRRERLRALRKLALVVALAVAFLVNVGAAVASPGDPMFRGCVGDLSGCTATTPAMALDGAEGVAVSPDGKQLYAVAYNGDSSDVSHFTVDSSGKPIFKGCVGDRSGCTATNPAGALDAAFAVAVSPDGKQLYVAAFAGVSHFTLDSSGKPTFRGCVGDLSGCTPTRPAGALEEATWVAVSPDGKQLYASAYLGNDVSYFTLGSSGKPTFRGCVGDRSGCTATTPSAALAGASGVAVSPDAKQLYATANYGNDVSHFTLGSSGKPTFRGCVGHLSGCTATHPALALEGADGVAISPDGKQLYATAGNDDVSRLTLGSSGKPTFKGCVGYLSGCTATHPALALDGADGVAVSPDGKQLYVAGWAGSDVSHLTLGSSGKPIFKGCVGHLSGCTATSPAGALELASGVAVSPNGKRLYVTAPNGPSSGDVSYFTLAQPQCVVPKLKAKTLAAAKQALKHAHCTLGKVTKKTSTRKAGIVLSQKPKPGKRLPAGSKVAVVVSKH